ncbi:Txe/YoeB family addiction module toxin [Brumimicrobium aurantiacum]|uniref:Putative mRNA interferase YoeB n=1 Tax=Brumimicrobium aurantiacum TaxID=1737063 RepID=A0A3E1EXN4_9FLAO|nr:Txe/YoeB family addiction module toxin [Brumimicrobium aurantiacum]RFC54325.1 Txe/YoeB family addiction module toxin [Brumimicrobium aurantiacum]
MKYELIYTKEAIDDLNKFKKSGNKVLLKKIATLLKEIKHSPFNGTGKPEELKHQYAGLWSRRINREHRLIYKVEDNIITITVLSLKGHYK